MPSGKSVGYNPIQKKLGRRDRVPDRYEELVEPHLDSFNFFLGPGLTEVVNNLEPVQV